MKVEVLTSMWVPTVMVSSGFGAACSVISCDALGGTGDPSLDSDSGVISPDMPTWLGDEGALRLVDEMNGALKQGTPRCLLRRKACSTSLGSEAWSIRQKEPLPGSS